jgi:hypothetical protein
MPSAPAPPYPYPPNDPIPCVIIGGKKYLLVPVIEPAEPVEIEQPAPEQAAQESTEGA